MNEALQALLASAKVWRAREKASTPPAASASPDASWPPVEGAPGTARVLPTGWPALDAALPDAGWPLGTLVEVLLPEHGLGELRLLLPALARTEAGRWLVWVAPPLAPYPPALAQAGIDPERVLIVDAVAAQDRLWATEQALRSRACDAVLAWLDAVEDRWLRRLCLAAEGGHTLAVAFRPLRCRQQSSPARLRLLLEPRAESLDVRVVKGRGGPRYVRNALG
ncbi:MAG: translesion DNA synthesis-associated protein ImuA [Steroidobacteraceae bacterium]|jgi:cell division inhibitor SulA/protein ImuA|nr:translesion DNA synthesis-associated protein ImuA [Steroidobacteraceae bacterium]